STPSVTGLKPARNQNATSLGRCVATGRVLTQFLPLIRACGGRAPTPWRRQPPPLRRSHEMRKKGVSLFVVAVNALLAAAGAGAKSGATTLNGAGSTFVSPLVSVWTPALGSAFDYTVQYAAVGSGGGIQAITNRQVDFGASDAPLTSDQFSACNGCVQ